MPDLGRQIHFLHVKKVTNYLDRSKKFIDHTNKNNASKRSVDARQAVYWLQGFVLFEESEAIFTNYVNVTFLCRYKKVIITLASADNGFFGSVPDLGDVV